MHVHVGQFKEKYYDPLQIGEILIEELDLEAISVSSTTSCGNYNIATISLEIEKLYQKMGSKIFHFLWLHPEYLPDRDWNYKSSIPINGIKIHPYAQNWNQVQLRKAWELASDWNIPILLHTGGDPRAYPLVFLSIISDFPEVQVCMAHGRPNNQLIEVLKQCPNVLTDTAFQNLEDIQRIISQGYTDRILYGSDFPITSYYSQNDYLSSESWISIYKQIANLCDEKLIEKIESNTRKFLGLI